MSQNHPALPAGQLPISTRGVQKAKELAERHTHGPDWKERRKIFTLFVLMNVIVNYDTGVIPASLIEIKREVPMSF